MQGHGHDAATDTQIYLLIKAMPLDGIHKQNNKKDPGKDVKILVSVTQKRIHEGLRILEFIIVCSDKNCKETTVSTFRILEGQKTCQLARFIFRLSSMRLSKR